MLYLPRTECPSKPGLLTHRTLTSPTILKLLAVVSMATTSGAFDGRKEGSEIISCPQYSARLHQEGTLEANKTQFISFRASLLVLIFLLCSIRL